MQSKRKVLATIGTTVFVLICLLWGAAFAWGQLRTNVAVPQLEHWEETAILCSESNVDSVKLAEAVLWWRNLGHDIIIDCEQRWTVSVYLDPTIDERASFDDVEYDEGRARRRVEGQTIVGGEIALLPSADGLVMAHEIGHILGYSHHWLIPSGHIMHPKRRGWDGRGVQRVQR